MKYRLPTGTGMANVRFGAWNLQTADSRPDRYAAFSAPTSPSFGASRGRGSPATVTCWACLFQVPTSRRRWGLETLLGAFRQRSNRGHCHAPIPTTLSRTHRRKLAPLRGHPVHAHGVWRLRSRRLPPRHPVPARSFAAQGPPPDPPTAQARKMTCRNPYEVTITPTKRNIP